MSGDVASPVGAVRETVGGGAPLLAGRTVVLTGATGGIGRAIAHVLAAAGARVAITDLVQPALGALERDLRATGADVAAAAIDAADRGAFADFVASTTASLGPIEGLVTCAGLFDVSPFTELGDDDWQRALTANLGTAVTACAAVLPGMLERGRGSIVTIASTAGEYGSISPAAHYAAAKGGVIGLTKSLAREAAPANVRVNAVSPGPIETAALSGASVEQMATIESRTLFNRLGQPDEIAGACAYLLSDLSTFVTGHVLRVNGGALL
jgi:NAD(P)-dependent dehydrogenase (short-subunit alcohol dehydrogenase family)